MRTLIVRVYIMGWLLLAVLPSSAYAGLELGEIKITSRGDTNAAYAIDMMKLALDKLDASYTVNITEEAMSALRLREGMDNDKIDVIWTATSTEMEQSYQTVRVPLYKGLLGYRILIIHEDNRELFKDVTTMDDVLKHTYGQGHGWTDTDIMRANGMHVIATPKYHSLFYMTDGKRFDAFPRGVHEPWDEVASRPELELTIDEHLLFVYKMPYYLFVSNHRPDLAKALRAGFELAIADGSFDERFLNEPTVQKVLNKANIAARQAFPLNNPDLPPATPLDRKELWFDVSTLIN